jgi:hypothetical protein
MTLPTKPAIGVNDLPPEIRKRLGVKRRAVRTMDINQVRTLALRVLNVVADLTPGERGRVLRHALKVNDV